MKTIAENAARECGGGRFLSGKSGPRASGRGFKLLAAASALLLAACSSTPPYVRPSLDVPAQFKEGVAFQRADPSRAQVPQQWWRVWDDAVLADLQARASVDNRNLQASAAAVAIAQAAVASSRAALFPTVGIGAAATRSRSPVLGASNAGAAGSAPITTSYSAQALVSSWEVDLWNRIGAQVDAATARFQASRADLAAAQLSLQATLVQTYFALRGAEAQIALLDRTVDAFSRSAQLTRNRYQAGVVSAADVAQAQSQLKSAEAQRVEARLNRAQLEHALAVLVGVPPAALDLEVTANLPPPPEVPVELPSTLLERRPDIAAAEARVAAANAQIGAADAAFFPAVTLSASAGLRSLALGDLLKSSANFWSIGPSLLWAAFDGGARRAASDSARASYDQTVAQYRQTVLAALQEVEDNLAAAALLDQEAAIQQDALDAAKKAQEVALNQYQAGIVSFINVVTAQASVLSAETTLLNLRQRQLVAANLLMKNIAGRWDAQPVETADSRAPR